MKKRTAITELKRKKRRCGKRVYIEAGCFFYDGDKRRWKSLGVWGTKEAERAYKVFCREYWASAAQEAEALPPGFCPLGKLVTEYLKARKNLDSRDRGHIVTVCKILLTVCPDIPASKFSAMTYRKVRDAVVAVGLEPGFRKPWSRQYINRLMNCLRGVFRWGISYDLVPPEVVAKIATVPPLRAGEVAGISDTTPRQGVPDAVVAATMPYMTPTVADMVRIQRGACMRPSEVCGLKVGDIDQSGTCWRAVLARHKTARCGVKRWIVFSADETEILRQRCRGKAPEDYIFSPSEAMEERWRTMAAKRVTPTTPSGLLRDAARAPYRTARLGDHYDAHAYARAVKYAILAAQKAGEHVEHWTPYQLRHAAVTATSLEHGREIASLQAGHTNLSTTAIYDHKAEAVAEQLAAERVAWWDQ